MEVQSTCHWEEQPPHRTTVPRRPVEAVDVLQRESELGSFSESRLCLFLQLQQTPHLVKHLTESFKKG